MIRHPLGLRLDPDRPVRDQIHEAARLGARGVVLDAIGDLAPHRLSETGRRELRHLLRTVELSLVGAVAAHAPAVRHDRPARRADPPGRRRLRDGLRAGHQARAGSRRRSPARGRGRPARGLHERPARAGRAGRAPRGPAGHRDRLRARRERSRSFLEALRFARPGRQHRPRQQLASRHRPGRSRVRELAAWVVHAYANDATGSAGVAAPNPRGFGFPPGALDWEEYLGALEEIGYQRLLDDLARAGPPAATQFSRDLAPARTSSS